MAEVITLDDALSCGFDAGNYASAYMSEYFEIAKAIEIEERDEGYVAAPSAVRRAWEAAFIIGFFASCENSEVSSEHLDELLEAHANFGAKMLENGIAVDPRDTPE